MRDRHFLLSSAGAVALAVSATPTGPLTRVWDPVSLAAVLIFAATYLIIAIGKLPGSYLDRAGAALLGASLMIGLGVLSLGEALRSIDFGTIALLLGMMIVVGNLRLSGFSAWSPIGW